MMTRAPLTVALPKGRLAEQALKLLSRCGCAVPELPPDSRKLVFDAPDGELRFILVKPSDVPIYVEYGVADLGIAGKDTILESRADVYDVLDLKAGRCRMVLAGPGPPESASAPPCSFDFGRGAPEVSVVSTLDVVIFPRPPSRARRGHAPAARCEIPAPCRAATRGRAK